MARLLEEVATVESKIGVQPTEDPNTAVNQLHTQLAGLLQHLRTSENVDPTLITMAEAHSSQLLEGFRKTFQAALPLKDPSGATKAVHRLTGKQPRPRPERVTPQSTVKRGRILVKRKAPTNRTLGDFFAHAAKSSADSDANEMEEDADTL